MSTVEENMRLMQTLDDAWNARDWETFDKRHAKEVDVSWPAQADPTHGRQSHREEQSHSSRSSLTIRLGTARTRFSLAREIIPARSRNLLVPSMAR